MMKHIILLIVMLACVGVVSAQQPAPTPLTMNAAPAMPGPDDIVIPNPQPMAYSIARPNYGKAAAELYFPITVTAKNVGENSVVITSINAHFDFGQCDAAAMVIAGFDAAGCRAKAVQYFRFAGAAMNPSTQEEATGAVSTKQIEGRFKWR